MTNSEQSSGVTTSFRKPKVSTTIDRKKVSRPMQTRTTDMVSKSSSQTQSREQIIRQQMMEMRQTQQVQSQQMQQTQQMQSQQMQSQQAKMQQMDAEMKKSETPQIQTRSMQTNTQTMQTEQSKSDMVKHFAEAMEETKSMQATMPSSEQTKQGNGVIRHMLSKTANSRMQQRMSKQMTPEKESAKDMKESAIEKAIASASRVRTPAEEKRLNKVHFGFKRILLALACATMGVFAIVFFVNLNSPNISLKVAAMQTGIEATYPKYVPSEYALSDITSENGKITLNFKSNKDDIKMTLIEEKSSWDSNTLEKNFVRTEFGDDFSTVREQGLTIYISGSSAAWVNGGIVYKLLAPDNTLTKKQINRIAVSL